MIDTRQDKYVHAEQTRLTPERSLHAESGECQFVCPLDSS